MGQLFIYLCHCLFVCLARKFSFFKFLLYIFFCVHMYIFVVSSCLRDLRSEALVFMAGIVKHITTLAVVQQCSSTNLLKQP